MMRTALVLFAATLGCTHVHSARNAPGHVDLEYPAAPLAPREKVRPDDPGERMVVLSPGVFGGGGVAVDPERTSGAWAAGVETGVHYGESSTSHREDTFFGNFLLPERSIGVNVGWTLLSQERAAPTVGYAEIQLAEKPYGIAGGWAWDPRTATSGPQVTAFVGPLYFRGTRLLATRTEAEIGLMVKLPVTWVWSR